jgi:DNA-binding SARP family transcriptional activator
VEFGVLGPLEVTARGQPLLVRGARTRAVLVLLLMHANQVVSADKLIGELWPGQPADRASASLQVRVSELRTALRSAQEAERLITRPPGYLIRVSPGELDALRFDRLVLDGQTALATGHAGLAARRLAEALSLWRGPPLAEVDAAPSAQAEVARLEERRIAALEGRAEALLACGRHAELVADLEALTKAYPLRERLWSHRMLALPGRTPGRRAAGLPRPAHDPDRRTRHRAQSGTS